MNKQLVLQGFEKLMEFPETNKKGWKQTIRLLPNGRVRLTLAKRPSKGK